MLRCCSRRVRSVCRPLFAAGHHSPLSTHGRLSLAHRRYADLVRPALHALLAASLAQHTHVVRLVTSYLDPADDFVPMLRASMPMAILHHTAAAAAAAAPSADAGAAAAAAAAAPGGPAVADAAGDKKVRLCPRSSALAAWADALRPQVDVAAATATTTAESAPSSPPRLPRIPPARVFNWPVTREDRLNDPSRSGYSMVAPVHGLDNRCARRSFKALLLLFLLPQIPSSCVVRILPLIAHVWVRLDVCVQRRPAVRRPLAADGRGRCRGLARDRDGPRKARASLVRSSPLNGCVFAGCFR